jgi:hypothetical protein
MLLGVIAADTRAHRDRHAWHWAVLALIFLGLSLDETASLHELTSKPLKAVVKAEGVLRYPWVVAGGAFVFGFIAAYLRFFLKLPPKIRWLFGTAGMFYVGGALGLELIEGHYATLYGGQGNMRFALLSTIEEVFEMTGALVFLYALMSYIELHVKEVRVDFTDH